MDDICGRDWGYGGGDHGDPGKILVIFFKHFILIPTSYINLVGCKEIFRRVFFLFLFSFLRRRQPRSSIAFQEI